MTSDMTLARPYADALFALAKDTSSWQNWDNALTDLATIAQDEHVTQAVAHPMVGSYACVELVKDVLAALKPDWLQALDKPIDSLVKLLLGEGRFGLLPSIATLFHEKWLESEGKKEAEITTAIEWPAVCRESLQKALNHRLGVQVDCHYKVDPAIKGGAIVAVDHWVLDGSVSTKLARLRESLEKVG